MIYKVINNAILGTIGGDLELKKGQMVKLPEELAKKLIEAGKIIPTVVDTIAKPFDGESIKFNPPKIEDTSKEKKGFRGVYEPTRFDLELQEYIGKPSLNPNGYKCFKCGAMGERYCLGEDLKGNTWWGWQCLRCRPYTEPGRN